MRFAISATIRERITWIAQSAIHYGAVVVGLHVGNGISI